MLGDGSAPLDRLADVVTASRISLLLAGLVSATATRDRLEALSIDDCLALLPTRLVGRAAVVRDGVPVVLPVNYAFVDGAVVFRTGTGALLDAAAAGAHIAFQVDDIDEHTHRGLSVLVTGRAQEVWDAVESTAALDHVGRPWAGACARRPDPVGDQHRAAHHAGRRERQRLVGLTHSGVWAACGR